MMAKVEGETENCPAPVPATEVPVMLSVALPVLDTMNVCVPDAPMLTVPKSSVIAEVLNTGARVPEV